jgi:hypothetical protein
VNAIMVKKKNGKWRMCTNFSDLNKLLSEGQFPIIQNRQGG